MPLHLLQLGPVPPPEGGISRNITAIRAEVAARKGHCTIIATSKSSSVVPEQDVYHPRSGIELLRLLRRLRSDVLHLHIGGNITTRVLLMALACTLFGRGAKVLTIHSGGFASTPAAKAAKRWSLAGIVFRRVDAVIAVNEDLANVLRRFGVASEKVRVILPYSLAGPLPSVEIPATLRAFAESHSPLVVSVGGCEHDYEPFLQLSAFQSVRPDLPNAGLVLIGGGSLQKPVEDEVRRSGLQDAVLVAGNVDHEVVLHLMREADIMLRVTLFDGDAISVREALFLGTRVIATDNRMRPAGVNLVPTGDVDALATAITKLAREPQGDRTAIPPADNSNIKQVVDLYESLLGK